MKALLFKVVTIGIVLTLFTPLNAAATNGMNMEGYGPISCGMGGASMAFDNGSAAMMNNPATLALMPPGSARLDLALGMLGPNVNSSVRTPGGLFSANSDADAFFMPALGFVKNNGKLTFGVAAFAQGGMGTEFGADSWMSDPSMGANSALTAGLVNRTEVSMGRVLLPLTYRIDDQLSIGGSFDVLWAGMDLQMAMSEAQFQDLVTTQSIGAASGSLVQGFGALYEPFGGAGVSTLHHAYFDFSNDNAFTGEARGYGVAGKLGMVYQFNNDLSVGATYHTRSAMSDMETENAILSMGVKMDTGIASGGSPSGVYQDMNIPVSGSITVENFEWPETYGIGLAYRPTSSLLFAADVKRINWAAVMEDFTMTFEADAVAENGAFSDLALNTTLYQNWKNQTVVSLGGEFAPTLRLRLRAGVNLSENPVPSQFLNSLFPAIVSNHLAFGAGYRIADRSVVNFSFFRAFEVTETNAGNGSTIPAVSSSHDQLNYSLMVTQEF
ncbi:MAG: aromatic hydrocarbon degradation protein [Candidatus Eisenbacteria bacterium]|uniref:Aromatic hydrocarbon degradation protein n=1 Tax=Eiseniibacteriota bacterium TaxID=2212470 RepID=A0A7Y2EDT0_UNCEI|nr:aromatic hydrocarbon degradation protein [Candidatus Eisenbacteria bacterium]